MAGKCHRPPAHLIFLNSSKAVRFSDGFFLLQIVKFLYNQVKLYKLDLLKEDSPYYHCIDSPNR